MALPARHATICTRSGKAWRWARPATPGEYILLVGSDNDFVTQHGHMAGQAYKDAAGADVDTLVMAWRVTLKPAP